MVSVESSCRLSLNGALAPCRTHTGWLAHTSHEKCKHILGGPAHDHNRFLPRASCCHCIACSPVRPVGQPSVRVCMRKQVKAWARACLLTRFRAPQRFQCFLRSTGFDNTIPRGRGGSGAGNDEDSQCRHQACVRIRLRERLGAFPLCFSENSPSGGRKQPAAAPPLEARPLRC